MENAPRDASADAQRPPALRRRYALVLAAYTAAAFAFFWWTRDLFASALLPAVGVVAAGIGLQAIVLWRALPQNRPSSTAPVAPTFGPANRLTLVRGVLVACLAAFLVVSRPTGSFAWLPALLVTISGLLDVVDGIVARRTGSATLLGATLDLEFDALSIILINLLVVRYGQLPPWFLIVGLARYLFVVGTWWRERRGLAVYPLPDSMDRRAQAGFMWGMLSVLLWPPFTPPATVVAGVLFGFPFALIFTRDWLVASGRLQPGEARYERARDRAKFWLQSIGPLVCRISAALLLLSGAVALPSGPLAVLGIAGVLLLVPALFGRAAALLTIAFAAFTTTGSQPPVANLALLACAIWIVTWGTGYGTLWTPENAIWARRYG